MRKKIIFINSLVSIQLVITFALATLLINMLFNFYNENDRYKKIISENKSLILNETVEDNMRADRNENLLDAFDKEGKGLIKYRLIYGESSLNFEELVDKYDDMERNGIAISSNNYTSDKSIHITRVSSDFYKRYPIEIYEGREFSETEMNGIFEKNSIPVIVGYDFRNYVQVGQELHIKLSENEQVLDNKIVTNMKDTNGIHEINYFTYKVIGIASRNTMVKLGADIPYSVSFTSDRAYIPYNSFHLKLTVDGAVEIERDGNENESDISKSIIECESEEYTGILKNNLNKKIKESGLTGRFSTIESNNLFKEQFNSSFTNIGMICVSILIFSVIGTMVVNIFTIRLKYKEYGIRLSQGATHKDIALSIVIKNAILVSSCSIIGFLMTYLITLTIEETDAMSISLFSIEFSSFIWIVFLVVIIIIITSILPIISLYKNSVVKLIREG